MNKIILPLLILSIILQFFTWSAGHNWGGDYANYIMQAVSISENSIDNFFYKSSLTSALSSNPLGPLNYPWGFPLMLAALYSIFGFKLIFFKALILLFFLLFLIIIWNISKLELKLKERFIYLSIFSFNPFLLEFNNQILSDIPFLFFSTFSIFLLSKLNNEKSKLKALIISTLLGVSFMWCAAIRTNGILLPISYLIYLLITFFLNHNSRLNFFDIKLFNLKILSSKIKNIIYVLPIIIFLILNWYFSQVFTNNQETHFDFLNQISVKTILVQAAYNSLIIKDFFGDNYFGAIIYIATLPLVFLGLKIKWKSNIFVIIYVVLTLALYTLWPFRQGLRFLIPILPFYVYFLVIGIRSIKKINNSLNIKKNMGFFIILILFSTSIFQIFENYKNGFNLVDGPNNKTSTEMFDYIKKNVSKNEIIIFRKPRVMTLYTKKNSIMYNNINDFEIREWYVVDKKNLMNIDLSRDKILKKYQALKVFENNQFIIYKFS